LGKFFLIPEFLFFITDELGVERASRWIPTTNHGNVMRLEPLHCWSKDSVSDPNAPFRIHLSLLNATDPEEDVSRGQKSDPKGVAAAFSTTPRYLVGRREYGKSGRGHLRY
jgi:hypothetical protein